MIRKPGDLPRANRVVPRAQGAVFRTPPARAATLSAAPFGQEDVKVRISQAFSRSSARATQPHRRRRLACIALGATLALPISLSVSAVAVTTSARLPITIPTPNGPLLIHRAPTRIVSLSPTATQMLFAIGAGKAVVAADADSTLPANAPRTSLSGLDPNVEAIVHYRPQLVIVSYNPNGLAATLHKLGIPLLEQDAAPTLRTTYQEIAQLGIVTNHTANAQRVIATMRSTIARLVAGVPHFSPRLSYYYELDQTYYSATSTTFIGSVMAQLGLRNIADAAPHAASGYPQLSAEFIVKANPDVIVLADTQCCGQSPKTVATRPGWKDVAAVRDNGVVGVNDSVASQWGPNVVTLVRHVAAALRNVASKRNA